MPSFRSISRTTPGSSVSGESRVVALDDQLPSTPVPFDPGERVEVYCVEQRRVPALVVMGCHDDRAAVGRVGPC
jgi:hypothetical protein